MSTNLSLVHDNTERDEGSLEIVPAQPMEIADLLVAYLEQQKSLFLCPFRPVLRAFGPHFAHNGHICAINRLRDKSMLTNASVVHAREALLHRHRNFPS
jgi:hypothetical protein